MTVSSKRIVEEIETLPNETLIKFYSTSVKGYLSFGKRVEVPKAVRELVRVELKERNSTGKYIFKSISERRNLKGKRAFIC